MSRRPLRPLDSGSLPITVLVTALVAVGTLSSLSCALHATRVPREETRTVARRAPRKRMPRTCARALPTPAS